MSDFDIKKRLKEQLDRHNIEDAGSISDFVDHCLHSGLAVDSHGYEQGPFTEWLNTCGNDLDNLSAGRFGRRRNQLLSRELLDAIVGMRRTLMDGFAFGPWGCQGHERTPDFLLRCGFVEHYSAERRLRFGYQRPGKHSLPATFFEALHNVPPLAFLPEPYAENYARCISGETPEWPPPDQLISVDFTQFAASLGDYYLDVLAKAKTRSNPWFVNLDNAIDFYLRIQSLYQCRADNSHDVYVFSTTSGLVVKEQFLGSNEMKTSQFRRTYFESMRRQHCRIFYQFDPVTTWSGPKGIANSTLPMKVHEEHLASFLEMQNLEISEITFDKPETCWRREFTIVTSRDEVVFSSRSPEVKEISEGLIVTDGFWANQQLRPWQAVRKLYREQLGQSRVIKHAGEKLNADDARKVAADTFRRWGVDLRRHG